MSQSVNNMFLKKTVLASAMIAALGCALPEPAGATVYKFSFAGSDGNVFTMLGSGGGFTPNSDLNSCNPEMLAGTSCMRTAINGSITYDTATGIGSMSIVPFSFFGSGVAAATTVSLRAIGNGDGNPASGNLILGNMGFNWNTSSGIPVSIVWDATGFFAAVNGGSLSPGSTVTGGALPASNVTQSVSTTYPIGPAVMAVTTWNTTTVPGVDFYSNPSGTLPLITDTQTTTDGSLSTGIGGSPMPTAPFKYFNANFDFTNLLVTCVNSDCGQYAVTDTRPVNGAFSTAAITITFSGNMQASTVFNKISLVDVTNGNTPVAITVTPSSGPASTFTIHLVSDQNNDLDVPNVIDLAYDTTYRATLDPTGVLDENDQSLDASPNNTWTWTTGSKLPAQVCASHVEGATPVGSNFSMLEKQGKVFGGTNDITYNLNFSSLNTSVTDTTGILTNTLASAAPHPFFGATWVAHHVRLFGPGTYSINTECSTMDLEGGNCAPNADPAKNLTMTVGTGQIGAHMLFDWNGNENIDVVNVWDQNTAWTDRDPGEKNNLWTGSRWAGPSGYTVHPQTAWTYVSTDSDGDGINGVKMIDGPFQGFSANFNLGPTVSCQETPPEPIAVESSGKVGGCSLGTGNANLTERGDWWLVAGFLAWLGLIRKRLARQRS